MTDPQIPPGFHDLVRRAQAGDKEAMDKVLVILQPYLAKMARPYADPSRPAESTSDLLQESCLRAWQKLGSFDGGENDEETFAMFRGWIAQIVKRLGLNAQRDHKRQKRSPPKKIVPIREGGAGPSTAKGAKIDPTDPGPTPSADARADEVSEKIRSALEALGTPTPPRSSACDSRRPPALRDCQADGSQLRPGARPLQVRHEDPRRRPRRLDLNAARARPGGGEDRVPCAEKNFLRFLSPIGPVSVS